jgi:ferric-dicitrate binding protein FerR (iron transport regulator)
VTEPIRPAELIQFLEGLRNPRVELRQQADVQELLAILLARGAWPEQAGEFRPLLAPLVCSSPDEQEAFYRAFAEWRKEERPQRLRSEELPPAPPTPTSQPRGHRARRLVTALMVVGVAAIGWRLRLPKPPPKQAMDIFCRKCLWRQKPTAT